MTRSSSAGLFVQAALLIVHPVMVVTVISNEREHDVDTTAGNLWKTASGGAL
jgi:hypothetical protein